MVPAIRLGENGPSFSRLVHGLWRLAGWGKDTRQVRALIDCCLERGITTFDHADIYGDYTCEQLFGEALAEAAIDRASIQFVTKCGIKLISRRRPNHRTKSYDTSAAHITASVENSLRSLRTDYIDLLLIHRPDPLMDPAEVNEAFVALKEAGKVRHFGVSNFLPSQFDLLAARLDVPLVTNQIEYSVMCLEAHADGTVDQCQRLDVRPMAWSPLGGGRLFHEESEQRLPDQEGGRSARDHAVPRAVVRDMDRLHRPGRAVTEAGTSRENSRARRPCDGLTEAGCNVSHCRGFRRYRGDSAEISRA